MDKLRTAAHYTTLALIRSEGAVPVACEQFNNWHARSKYGRHPFHREAQLSQVHGAIRDFEAGLLIHQGDELEAAKFACDLAE